jgi:hypothetical protein
MGTNVMAVVATTAARGKASLKAERAMRLRVMIFFMDGERKRKELKLEV